LSAASLDGEPRETAARRCRRWGRCRLTTCRPPSGSGWTWSGDRTAAKRPTSTGKNARATLETLPIKGRAPKTGHRRDRFGDGWLTVN
jgi:hypothetical protein